MSSSVTIPDVPPCSSMISAICVFSRRIVASTASSGAVSGTIGSGLASASRSGSLRSSSRMRSLMWIMPTI
jgi:hypothetical protein